MEYISGTKEFHLKDTAVALGKFDGLHKGHRILIDKITACKAQGLKAVMFTFDFHPAAWLKNKPQDLIFTREERKQWAKNMGIDVLIEFPFDAETSAQEAEDFVKKILVEELDAKVIVSGTDFRFGHNRRGSVEMLAEMGKQYGFRMDVCEKLQMEAPIYDASGRTDKIELQDVSSTLIRQAITFGDIEIAAQLLGTPYAIHGDVIHGKAIGRTLSFPTANITPEKNKITPPNGVYISRVLIGDKSYRGISNIGYNPTVSHDHVKKIETFILDFQDNIYDERITVEFLKFVRPEMKFNNVEALRRQIDADVAFAKKYKK